MLGVYVNVPVAGIRKGHAREYLETHPIPPPATCYGFLLSLIGERDRSRHIGCRVTAVILTELSKSVVLRKIWRVKNLDLSSPKNIRPDFQELLSNLELILWLDSTEERAAACMTLEERVKNAIAQPESINRSGGLSLGESTHLVNEVTLVNESMGFTKAVVGKAFLLERKGNLTLPVWVDHVSSIQTRYATGNLVPTKLKNLPRTRIPVISPD